MVGWDIFSTGMVGSLYHLSPEQLEGRCYSGEKIDIWAIGILLCVDEIITMLIYFHPATECW
jgi:serine/threonine protein kinase